MNVQAELGRANGACCVVLSMQDDALGTKDVATMQNCSFSSSLIAQLTERSLGAR